MELDILLVKGIIILVIFGISLGIATWSTWAERRVAAWFQDRRGPNRAGIFGLMQPLADAVKLFTKEEFIPSGANKWLFILGPSVAMLTALMSSAVIPFGSTLEIGDKLIPVQGIEVNIGILFSFGVISLGVYGIMIGGWASNNKFSLLGAVRAGSQNISYELALGMSLVALVMMSGSLDLRKLVEDQHGFHWNVFYQPLAFIIFLTCAFAECNRTPFDLPESENELVGGYHTEYSSMKMGLYLFSEYENMFISSAIISALFFGGYNYPGMDFVASLVPHNVATLIGVGVMFAKSAFFIFFFMWVRWTIPRFRYDQLMSLGWKSLIPLSIVNIIITGCVMLAVQHFRGEPVPPVSQETHAPYKQS